MSSMFDFDDSRQLAFQAKTAGKALIAAKYNVLQQTGDFLFNAHTDGEFAQRCAMIDDELSNIAYNKLASISDSKTKLVKALHTEWSLRHAKCQDCNCGNNRKFAKSICEMCGDGEIDPNSQTCRACGIDASLNDIHGTPKRYLSGCRCNQCTGVDRNKNASRKFAKSTCEKCADGELDSDSPLCKACRGKTAGFYGYNTTSCKNCDQEIAWNPYDKYWQGDRYHYQGSIDCPDGTEHDPDMACKYCGEDTNEEGVHYNSEPCKARTASRHEAIDFSTIPHALEHGWNAIQSLGDQETRQNYNDQTLGMGELMGAGLLGYGLHKLHKNKGESAENPENKEKSKFPRSNVKNVNPEDRPFDWERDASKLANKYIEKRGDSWVILQKGTGKVLSHHDSKEKAEASFRAMMQSKHGSKGDQSTCAECGAPATQHNVRGYLELCDKCGGKTASRTSGIVTADDDNDNDDNNGGGAGAGLLGGLARGIGGLVEDVAPLAALANRSSWVTAHMADGDYCPNCDGAGCAQCGQCPNCGNETDAYGDHYGSIGCPADDNHDMGDMARHDQGHDDWHAMYGDEPCTSEEDCAAKRSRYDNIDNMRDKGEPVKETDLHDALHEKWHRDHGDEPCTSIQDCARKSARYNN